MSRPIPYGQFKALDINAINVRGGPWDCYGTNLQNCDSSGACPPSSPHCIVAYADYHYDIPEISVNLATTILLDKQAFPDDEHVSFTFSLYRLFLAITTRSTSAKLSVNIGGMTFEDLSWYSVAVWDASQFNYISHSGTVDSPLDGLFNITITASYPSKITANGRTDNGELILPGFDFHDLALQLNSVPKPKPKLATGTIAGIAVGGFLVILGVIALVWFLLRRKRRNRTTKEPVNKLNGGSISTIGLTQQAPTPVSNVVPAAYSQPPPPMASTSYVATPWAPDSAWAHPANQVSNSQMPRPPISSITSLPIPEIVSLPVSSVPPYTLPPTGNLPSYQTNTWSSAPTNPQLPNSAAHQMSLPPVSARNSLPAPSMYPVSLPQVDSLPSYQTNLGPTPSQTLTLSSFAQNNRDIISEQLEQKLAMAGYEPRYSPDTIAQDVWARHGVGLFELTRLKEAYERSNRASMIDDKKAPLDIHGSSDVGPSWRPPR